ncbi:hypothetical protein, partial [uncultured Streptococcus sp.]|uniref:hypothetical protein n=1 Tax=uncultured Streptococcus sp. TaxID=83427 RepID=UPI0025E69DD7
KNLILSLLFLEFSCKIFLNHSKAMIEKAQDNRQRVLSGEKSVQSLGDTFLSACANSADSSARRADSRYESEVTYFMRTVEATGC